VIHEISGLERNGDVSIQPAGNKGLGIIMIFISSTLVVIASLIGTKLTKVEEDS